MVAEAPEALPATFGRATVAASLGRAIVLISAAVTTLCLPRVLDRHLVGEYFLAQLIIALFTLIGQLGFIYTTPAELTKAVAQNDRGRARTLILLVALICG